MENSNPFLLDTHIFIWWMQKSKKLSREAYRLINDPQNQVFLSVASIWEMVIKKAKRKLKEPINIEGGINTSGFSILPIEISHVLEVEKLPSYHEDPFDRILIAQAKSENLILITTDAKIKKYDVKILN